VLCEDDVSELDELLCELLDRLDLLLLLALELDELLAVDSLVPLRLLDEL